METKGASAHGVRRAEGKSHKGVKKEIEGLRMRKGENGGHVITHEYKRPEQRGDRYIPAPEPDDFIFGESEGKQAMEHIAKHMGVKMAAAKAESEGGGEEEEEEGE